MSPPELTLTFQLLNAPRPWATPTVNYGAGPATMQDLQTFGAVSKRAGSLPVLVTCEERNFMFSSIVDTVGAMLPSDAMILINVKSLRVLPIDRRLVRPNLLILEQVAEEYEYLHNAGVRVVAIDTALKEFSVEEGDNTITVRIPDSCLPPRSKLEEAIVRIERLGFRKIA